MKSITDFVAKKTGSSAADLSILSVIFGIAYFQFLGKLPLIPTDEARYLEIPREMLERGDFITPTLNYVKYFEKPPLHYWMNVLATLVFGETAVAARFIGALWGVLGILMVYHLGRKLYGRREAILSALVLGTSLGFITQARINITDTTLTFCMVACLGSFLLASRPGERRKGLYYHLFYLFAALAVLAKGLIGIVLPGGVVFFYMLLAKRWNLLKEMRLLTGIPLFFLVCAPWFVLVSLRNPEFPHFFFIHEHFERYLTKVHGRYQPPWFYVPILFGCLLPWSFFLPSACASALRERVRDDSRLYLLVWTVLIFGFFSLSDSKLVPYILPVYAPLALLIGCAFSQALDTRAPSIKRQAWALAAVHIIGGIGVIAYPYLARAPKLGADGALLLGGVLLAQGVLALVNCRRPRAVPLFCGLACVAYLLCIAGPPVVLETIAKRKVTRELALKVRDTAGQDAIVACFGYEQELPLYTKRRIMVVGSMGELEFGSKQGDQSAWFVNEKRFAEVWSGEKQVFALVTPEDLRSIGKTLQPPPAVLGSEGKRTLITNRAAAPGVTAASLAAPRPQR